MTNYTDNKEYYGLVAQWAVEKKLEQQANSRRLAIEGRILTIIKPDLKESGTNNFFGGLKVLTGLAATCDKEKVNNLYQKYINNEIPVPEFPFKHKWEPELKTLNALRLNIPVVYNQYFLDAVTVKPKKPAFEVKISELN